MIQYIYFVKCPGCEDEHFDFFDEAKEFALGCLSQKPIITQTEVCRNDFGECTDSCDIGTVWSWEDMMGKETAAEPTKSIFTKDDLKLWIDDKDPEFDTLDNSVDYEVAEPVTSEVSAIDVIPDNFRKPIPEGMTIEQLVEEMEENEDEVECALCQELFAKSDCYYDEDEGYICPECKENTVKCTWCGMHFDPSECRKEVDLGWLCSRCEAAIKSRGETLTFKEGNYWDFLDEAIQTKTWVCTFEGKEIGTVEATTEEDAAEKMQRKYPDYNYSLYDGCFDVFPADKEDLMEASLSDILTGANRELGTGYNERDLLDAEGIDDGEFFDDLETNIELFQDVQKRKRARQAFAINKASAEREARQHSKLEELEEAADYRKRLVLCPECGDEHSYDRETSFCLNCGFN